MKYRIGTILVCILLIASSSVIVYPIKSLKVNGNTLYVGGSGPGNYTRIQDAIDNASYGDTVFVYNGVYNESLDVYKSINLIGEDKNNTVISLDKSRDTGVTITSNQINLSGFKIEFNGEVKFSEYGVLIKPGYKSVIVSDNNIINHRRGIYSGGANKIIGNNILNNDFCGIVIHGSSNFIEGNNISRGNNHGDIGIDLYGSGNTITGNYFYPNEKVTAIWIRSSSSNIITNNIMSNINEGIFLDSRSSNNQIIGNEMSYNYKGIYVNENTHNNLISKNNFISSSCVFYKYFFDNIKWYNNYWGVGLGVGPKLIIGYLMFRNSYFWSGLPWFDFDWHPAKEPFDIPIPNIP